MVRPNAVGVDSEQLRELRTRGGLTQSQLAERAGLTARTVQAAEGGGNVSADSARRLASALSVPYMSLLRPSPVEVQERLNNAGYGPLPKPSPWGSRDAHTEDISRALSERSDKANICYLAGPTGIGKTALARAVIPELLSEFTGGIAWISCYDATIVRFRAWQIEIASALGFAGHLPSIEVVGGDALDHAFARRLWSERRLVVLDDLRDAAILRRILSGVDGGRVLITTTDRSVIREIPGTVFEVGPLGEDAALELLAAHIGAARIQGDLSGARELVRACSGVPRSLQIAGRVLVHERYLPIGEYAAQVAAAPAEPQGLAYSPAADPSDRDESLMTAYAQLRDRVDADRWALFGALAVFGNRPFTERWAAGVAGMTPEEARRHLGALADFYLLTEEHQQGALRFQLDAQSQRAARWAAGESMRRHEEALLSFALSEARRLAGLEPLEAAAQFTAHTETWRVCLDRAVDLVFSDEEPAIPTLPEAVVSRETDQASQSLAEVLMQLRAPLYLTMPAGIERWLHAGLTVAEPSTSPAVAGHLRRLMARWVVQSKMDISPAMSWCEAAGDALLAGGAFDGALEAHAFGVKIRYFFDGPSQAATGLEELLTQYRDVPISNLARASVLNAAGVVRSLCEDGTSRAHQLLAQAIECAPRDEMGTTVRSIAILNLALLDEGHADAAGAFQHLSKIVEDDEIDVLRLSTIAALAGLNANDDWDENRRKYALLSVPPEGVVRRLLNFRELAFELPHFPEQRYGITGIVHNTPLDMAVGDPGLLYPLSPMKSLLDDTGLDYALDFLEHVGGRSHPVYQHVSSLRAAPKTAGPPKSRDS